MNDTEGEGARRVITWCQERRKGREGKKRTGKLKARDCKKGRKNGRQENKNRKRVGKKQGPTLNMDQRKKKRASLEQWGVFVRWEIPKKVRNKQ